MHRPRLGFSLLKVPEYFPHLILIFKCERNAAANITLRLVRSSVDPPGAAAFNGFLVERAHR